ncbi:hypothetical protein ACFRFQ_28780 [Rhodococcus sp. NPDC056743]|uniref:hypothetical protein n=1 Tax=Rhodococcus sp. NPDC056743 TaxID=3345934 RepID=UPI00366DAE6E
MSVDVTRLSILRNVESPEGFPAFEVKSPKGVGRGFRCLFREFENASDGVVANVRWLIDFRVNLTPGERSTLDASFLWPLELVESSGVAVGYLTAVVPGRFEEQVQTPYSGRVTVARTLDWLNNPAHAKDAGASVIVEPDDIIVRSAYCAQIARATAFLHSRGVVFGDIGPLRVVTSDSPIDVVMIGSEFMHAVDSPWPGPGVHSPGMTPPECIGEERVQDVGTDLFKLSLIFRDVLGAAPEQTSQSSPLSALVGRVDHCGIEMFERGLGSDPGARPSAVEWYAYLYSQTIAHSAPPVIEMFGADPEHGIRHQSIEFTWSVQGHRRLKLETPWGEVQELDISASRHRLTLRQSGQFRLIASNPSGTTERPSDIVYAFDPPAVRFVEVPELGGVAQAITGLDSTVLSDRVVQGAEFNWLYGNFDALAMPELPPLPELPQFDSPGVPLQQIDWTGLTSIVNDAMRAADTEVRHGATGRGNIVAKAGTLFARVRLRADTLTSGLFRSRTR